MVLKTVVLRRHSVKELLATSGLLS